MKALGLLANVVAVVGILMCLVAGGYRLYGAYYVGGYEAMSIFNAGVGAMVFAVLVKLEAMQQAGKSG